MKYFLSTVVLLIYWLTAVTLSQSPTNSTEGCADGQVYNSCGSKCLLTCDNYQEPPVACEQVCVEGCFCAEGLLEHNGSCVSPQECPVQTEVNTTEGCADGQVYNSCGSKCLLTCDNYQEPPVACEQVCVEGCFCADGLLEHNGSCVSPQECPQACPADKVYSECGTACPLTCDNYRDPPACVAVCVSGCVCPEGQVLLQSGSCVQPSQCPDSAVTPAPCRFSLVSPENGSVSCHPECLQCNSEQHCELREGQTVAECVYTPNVPCDSTTTLQCDSEYTHCLQHNLTGAANCVGSCLASNGGCGPDEVCVTTVDPSTDPGLPSLQCLDRYASSGDCPAGQLLNECGAYCQETCEQRVSGEQFACIEVCGPPACVCPRGLLLFRDRCVDPRLCYILVNYQPAISPLPLVKADQFLYSLISPGSSLSDFDQEPFVSALSAVLGDSGYSGVKVQLHGVHQEEDLQIVVLLSGDGMSEDSSLQVSSILTDHTHQLPLDIGHVTILDVDKVTPTPITPTNEEEEDKDHLWRAVLYVLIPVLLLTVALLVILVACLACQTRGGKSYRHSDSLKYQVETHSLMASSYDANEPSTSAKDDLPQEYFS